MRSTALSVIALALAISATPATLTSRAAPEGCLFTCPTEYLTTSVSFDRYGYIVCRYKFPRGYSDCFYWLADGGFRGGSPVEECPTKLDTICPTASSVSTEPTATA